MKLENRNAIAFDLDLDISLPMMAACGEDIFNLRGELMVFDQGGECWLDLLSRLGDLGTVVFSSDEELKSFKSGQTAWVIASTALRDDLIEAIGVTNLKVDPWPLYESEGFPLRGFTWSENAYLVAGSTESDLEASWKFIQFLFGNEGQEILSDPGGAAHIPTTSVTEPPDSLMLESSSMLRAGIPIPLKSNLDIVREPILSAIQAVVMQGADPNFALRMAEERLELLLSSSLTD
jgi:ABC-type glycerol-3-phosphate transport system substrate-binding protein